MAYSPPGYFSFEKIFEKVAFRLENSKIHSRMLLTNNYIILDLDDDNRLKIEKMLKDPSKIIGSNFTIKEIDTSKQMKYKEVYLTCANLDGDKYIFDEKTGKTRNFTIKHLQLLTQITKVWSLIRNSLCGPIDDNKSFLSWLQYNNQKHSIPSIIWISDYNWYGLIYDGKISPDSVINSIYPKQNARRDVFFKEEIVKLSTPLVQEPLTQEAFHMETPWLKIMSAISLKHGEEIKSKRVTIESLVEDMKDYINNDPDLKSLQPPVSFADMKNMAKFIRLPEQRKGKSYNPEKS